MSRIWGEHMRKFKVLCIFAFLISMLFVFGACGNSTKNTSPVISGTITERRIIFDLVGETYYFTGSGTDTAGYFMDAVDNAYTEGYMNFMVSDYNGFALLGEKAYDIKSEPKEISVNAGDVVVDEEGHILIAYGAGKLKGELVGSLTYPDPANMKPYLGYVTIKYAYVPKPGG